MEQTEKQRIRRALDAVLITYLHHARAREGDAFATEAELKSLCSDPLGAIRMLDGVSAAEFIGSVHDATLE